MVFIPVYDLAVVLGCLDGRSMMLTLGCCGGIMIVVRDMDFVMVVWVSCWVFVNVQTSCSMKVEIARFAHYFGLVDAQSRVVSLGGGGVRDRWVIDIQALVTSALRPMTRDVHGAHW